MNAMNDVRKSERTTLILCAVALVVLAGFSCAAHAARPMTIKLATVAPKGSVYHRVMQDIGEAWRKAQGGNARFIIYTDGTQGTEAETVRRMRVGQLQASMLTVSGLLEIEPSVTALQFMPATFRNWDEVDYVLEKLGPDLEHRFEQKGYKLLLWGMGGWVQFFSARPRMMPDDFRDAKIFTWAGTPEQAPMMISMGFNPVVLDLPDLLPALQSGMIDVVPVAPIWALSGQFYRYAPHMLKTNWAPIVGATVISMKTWNTMRPEAREAMMEAAAQAEVTLREHRKKLDGEAIAAMQARGLEVSEPDAVAHREWVQLVSTIWPKIRGSLVPEETFDRVHELLANYRAAQ